MIPIDIRADDRILIVAPHPDDECIGAGGVLARYGAQCDVLLLTNGSACDPTQPREEIIATRHAEFLREMELAGVHRYWELGIEDETLMQHTDCLTAFDLAPYDRIFVTNHADNHPDHQAAAACVRRALAERHLAPAVYEYEIATPLAAPDEYLDITEAIEQKLAFIRCHTSQLGALDYVSLARSLNAYRAVRDPRMAYAEAYARMNLTDTEADDLARLAAQKQRYQHLYHIACRWLERAAAGHRIADVLEAKGVRTVALYGDTPFARIIARALDKTQIEIAYLIDRKGMSKQLPGIKAYRPDEELPEVDLVINTVVHDDDAIRTLLSKQHLKSISLDDYLQTPCKMIPVTAE